MIKKLTFRKKLRIGLFLSILIVLLSGLTLGSAIGNETIEVRMGDQFIIDSWEHSFEYDSDYISMVVNANGTETFTPLKVGNTTINHRSYPKGGINTYNVSIRELTFMEYISKLIDDFFNNLKK
ncbi:MAG: hypothetical protein LBT10_08330 [Methanobrevibacter sp.]|jgi:hypothetical protein|nr:hypothetical protein [Methanobrevibacter sp.]